MNLKCYHKVVNPKHHERWQPQSVICRQNGKVSFLWFDVATKRVAESTDYQSFISFCSLIKDTRLFVN